MALQGNDGIKYNIEQIISIWYDTHSAISVQTDKNCLLFAWAWQNVHMTRQAWLHWCSYILIKFSMRVIILHTDYNNDAVTSLW